MARPHLAAASELMPRLALDALPPLRAERRDKSARQRRVAAPRPRPECQRAGLSSCAPAELESSHAGISTSVSRTRPALASRRPSGASWPKPLRVAVLERGVSDLQPKTAQRSGSRRSTAETDGSAAAGRGDFAGAHSDPDAILIACVWHRRLYKARTPHRDWPDRSADRLNPPSRTRPTADS